MEPSSSKLITLFECPLHNHPDAVVLDSLFMHIPQQGIPGNVVIFLVISLGGAQWLAVLALAAAPVVICEAAKAVRR